MSLADEAPVYETEYFAVELPPSWGNAWNVELGQEYRSALGATNYSYAFTFDGAPQFAIECKLFSLNADAAIGSTGARQVEFYASDSISPENEFYVREHINVKQESAVMPEIPSNPYYKLSLPPELSGADVSYEEGTFGGPTTAGAITSVLMNGELLFDVICLSDDWGPQGDMARIKIGSPSSDPSSVVYLTVPVRQTKDYQHELEIAEAKAREYVSYVTLL